MYSIVLYIGMYIEISKAVRLDSDVYIRNATLIVRPK